MLRRNSENYLGKRAKENSYSSGDETSNSGQNVTNNDGVYFYGVYLEKK